MSSSILIVEDKVIIAQDLKDYLQTLGFETPAIAHDPREARSQFDCDRVDLALLDVNLPGSDEDGVDLAEDWSSRTPVVFLTAFSNESTLETLRGSGAEGYLLKPVGQEQLERVVRHFLDGAPEPEFNGQRGGFF